MAIIKHAWKDISSVGRERLSANDIRALERMTPISAEEGGDKYMVNGNMVDLKNAGHFARKDANADE